MKILIITGTFIPMSPSGPAYIAGAVRESGREVEVFDCLFADDLIGGLEEKLSAFGPDVVGLSITTVTGDILDPESEFGTKYIDFRPRIRDLVGVAKRHSDAVIVPGGCGFNYYARDWLDYLDLDYGLRGEAEHSFPLYIEKLEKGEEKAIVPGCIIREDGQFRMVDRDWVRHFDTTALPAYDLFDLDQYRKLGLPFALFTKRGCAFKCTFCPHSSLEGRPYRLKSPKRVVDEIEHVTETTGATSFNFCDNSFNCPKSHAEAICREIIDRRLKIKWQTGAMKPLRMTRDFCQLIKDSGCDYVGLSIESASEAMLAHMGRGYGVEDIEEALSNLSDSDISFGVFTLLGAPGETPETITETFKIIDNYPKIDQTSVNIGIRLWTHHQRVLEIARRDGQFVDDRELFDGAYYISPELPRDFMVDFIESLKSKKGYSVQVNKPHAIHS